MPVDNNTIILQYVDGKTIDIYCASRRCQTVAFLAAAGYEIKRTNISEHLDRSKLVLDGSSCAYTRTYYAQYVLHMGACAHLDYKFIKCCPYAM